MVSIVAADDLATPGDMASAGLTLDIFKMESRNHLGRTANIFIQDIIHIISSSNQQKHVYFADGMVLSWELISNHGVDLVKPG